MPIKLSLGTNVYNSSNIYTFKFREQEDIQLIQMKHKENYPFHQIINFQNLSTTNTINRTTQQQLQAQHANKATKTYHSEYP